MRESIRLVLRRGVVPVLSIWALLFSLAAGCGTPSGPSSAGSFPDGGVRRVLMISIDTLRADYLTPYDPERPTSPHLAALAGESALFTNAMATAGSTMPSHWSLFYGVYPWIHKAIVGKNIPRVTVTAPVERLRGHGLLTAGFVGGGKVSKRFGFGTGFDVYEDVSRRKTDKEEWEHRRIPELERMSFEWLDAHHDQDFFLFLHTYKVHCPYDPPEELARKYTDDYRGGEYHCGTKRSGLTLDDEYMKYVSALYAGEVEYVDAFVGRIVDHLKKLGIYDNTMIVILSDHGELLGEHGEIGHNSVHDACLRVPLIVRVPGVTSRKIDAPVALIDVIPTILAFVGAEMPYRSQGESLLPVMRGEKKIDPERVRFASSNAKTAVRSGPWKLVFSTLRQEQTALYDLSKDAGENDDVAGKHPGRVEQMRGLFDRMLAANSDLADRFVLTGEDEPVVDERVLEQLRTLGYIE